MTPISKECLQKNIRAANVKRALLILNAAAAGCIRYFSTKSGILLTSSIYASYLGKKYEVILEQLPNNPVNQYYCSCKFSSAQNQMCAHVSAFILKLFRLQKSLQYKSVQRYQQMADNFNTQETFKLPKHMNILNNERCMIVSLYGYRV
jgi:hypothetical protein